MEQASPPIDMSLIAPRPERLQQLAQELFGQDYAGQHSTTKMELYKLAQMEQLVSAMSVLAQFCAGAR